MSRANRASRIVAEPLERRVLLSAGVSFSDPSTVVPGGAGRLFVGDMNSDDRSDLMAGSNGPNLDALTVRPAGL